MLLFIDFPSLVKSFQKSLYRHHACDDAKKLYSVEDMRAFCDIHAPGLFDMIEKCLFCDYSVEQIESKNELRQQRVVGELYRLAYLGNQVKTTETTVESNDP